MELQQTNKSESEMLNRIIVKKDGMTYEISADRKIQDLLKILLPLNTQNENIENSTSLKNTKQNFVFQINQNNGIKIKSVFKDEYLSGKAELEDLRHPFFSDPKIIKNQSNTNLIKITDDFWKNNIDSFNKLNLKNGNEEINSDYFATKNSNNINENPKNESLDEISKRNFSTDKKKSTLSFHKLDKILVFSPHPDDEILGACGLLYKCFNESYKIKVVYMTSGKGGGEVNIRRQEAIEGIKKLGGGEKDLIFTNMPFYEKKDKLITGEDYAHAYKIIEEENPTNIFICSDIFDPNGTHRKCYDILLDIFNSKKYLDIKFYFYYSVWYWPKANEYSHILPYDYETYKVKIYAMLEHKSQLANKFMGGDPRPFYQRATTRDGHYGRIHNSDFCEVYYLINEHESE